MKHGITISLYDVDLVDVKSAIWSTSLVGWVFRVTILLHRYFMGETRDGYIETRVIRAQLKFEFSGAKTAVFKPGMPFERHTFTSCTTTIRLFHLRNWQELQSWSNQSSHLLTDS